MEEVVGGGGRLSRTQVRLCGWAIAIFGAAVSLAIPVVSEDIYNEAIPLGGIVFALVTGAAVYLAKDVNPVGATVTFVLALTFGVWSVFVGALFAIVLGIFGLPHALLTMASLRWATGSWLVAGAAVWGLAPAWGAATLFAPLVNPTAPWMDGALPIAVGVWNAIMAFALAYWAVRARTALDRPFCPACPGCGFDLTGVPGEVCPECGAVHGNTPV